jgi:hypothetical protein
MPPASMVNLGSHLPLTLPRVETPPVTRPTGVLTIGQRMRSPRAAVFIEAARTLAAAVRKIAR